MPSKPNTCDIERYYCAKDQDNMDSLNKIDQIIMYQNNLRSRKLEVILH
jgi:hypothetical protein